MPRPKRKLIYYVHHRDDPETRHYPDGTEYGSEFSQAFTKTKAQRIAAGKRGYVDIERCYIKKRSRTPKEG